MSFSDDLHDFIVEFDVDEVKIGELGVYRTRAWTRSTNVSDAVDSDADTNPVIAEMETSGSYLSATLSTVQPLGGNKSLLVLVVNCHPGTGRRFMDATITWKFAPTTSVINRPKVIELGPQQSIGGWTEEQTRILWGITVPVQAGFMGAQVGVVPSHERETQKVVMHAMTIVGSKRSKSTRCVWTVEENRSSARGIPTHFQFGVVVDHVGPFVIELDVKATLGGNLWPTYVRSKRDTTGGSLKKTIDVEICRRGEVVWEPGEQGWKKFIAKITGEVPSAVHNFQQEIIRP